MSAVRLMLSAVLPVGMVLAATAPEPPPLRFTVFSARPIAELVFVPGPDAPPVPLTFYSTARSPEYEHRADAPLQFLNRTTGAVAAEAIVPPGIRAALLLFIPQAAYSHPRVHRYQIQIIDDAALQRAARGLAIVNLSGLPLHGNIEGRPITVRPGLNSARRIGDAAAVDLGTVLNGRRYRSYADTVTLAAGERALLILFPPFYPGSLEVQGRLLVDEPRELPSELRQ
jgi:hypothetical protein